MILMCVQLGCQEKYTNSDSETLDITKNLCPVNDKESLEHTMKYTRYFGPGTSNLVFALAILYYEF